MPKATPDAVQKVLTQRANAATDGDALVKLFGPAAPDATAKSGSSFRVNVEVRLDNGAFGSAEVVILISSPDDNEPYHVLAWRDASDGPL